MPTCEWLAWRRDEFELTTDRGRMHPGAVHAFLAEQSYWAKGLPRAVFDRSFRNSLCFGLLHQRGAARQVGFARVVTDYATVAYLADVYVLPEFRGQGLAKWMVGCILAHPELANLRRWVLVTLDAQGLYRQFGFGALAHPERYMEIHSPGVYEAG